MKRKNHIALIGVGYWGKKILLNLNNLEALSGYVDNQAKVEGIKQLSMQAVLEDTSITAVVIATPSNTHADLVTLCLKHNKHVFVEKPICLSLAEADRLTALAKAQNKILMIGYLMMFHPITEALRDMYHEGILHDCHSIIIQRHDLLTPRHHESVWWDLAVHDISMLHMIFGALPEHRNIIKHRMPKTQYDTLHYYGSIALKNQTIDVHMSTSWISPIKAHTWTLCTTHDLWVFKSDHEHELYHYANIHEHRQPEPATIPLHFSYPLFKEMQHFIDCIDQLSTPITDHTLTRDIMVWLDSVEKTTKDTPHN
jgi:UDP-2-acetamido-3-amino-2,3-dideoxy-glucuronate N-acetyltransferase